MAKNRKEKKSKPSAERRQEIEVAVMRAYKHALVHRDHAMIDFGMIKGMELATLFTRFSDVVAPTLAYLNVEPSKIKRDLGFDFSTAAPLTEAQAMYAAGYTKAYLKEPVPIQAVVIRALYAEEPRIKRVRKRNVQSGQTVTRGLSRQKARRR